MKDLHDVVLDALALHASYEIPEFQFDNTGPRLVVASGNALPTGHILHHDDNAVFANETHYVNALTKHPELTCATVVSASGEKHSPIIVKDLMSRGLDVTLVTCEPSSSAAQLLPASAVCVTRAEPEPITYNTSTYLGMVLAKTRENPAAIREHILDVVRPTIPDFSDMAAFYILVDPAYDIIREMFITKFDELFGGRVAARCFTTEQTLHAKTVVPWEREIFIALGAENKHFGEHRYTAPLTKEPGFAATIAVGYYVIGHIQAQFPPYFKQHAEEYARIQKSFLEA